LTTAKEVNVGYGNSFASKIKRSVAGKLTPPTIACRLVQPQYVESFRCRQGGENPHVDFKQQQTAPSSAHPITI